MEIVLLEKLTGFQPVKKFPAFYGTRRFITAFTNARTCSYPESARPVHATTSHFLKIRLNIILPLRLGLPSGLISSGFPTKTLYTPLLSPIRATCSAHLILLHMITGTIVGEYRSLSSSLFSSLHSPVTSSLLGTNILLSTLFSNTLSLRFSLNINDQVCTHTKQHAKIYVHNINK